MKKFSTKNTITILSLKKVSWNNIPLEFYQKIQFARIKFLILKDNVIQLICNTKFEVAINWNSKVHQ